MLFITLKPGQLADVFDADGNHIGTVKAEPQMNKTRLGFDRLDDLTIERRDPGQAQPTRPRRNRCKSTSPA